MKRLQTSSRAGNALLPIVFLVVCFAALVGGVGGWWYFKEYQPQQRSLKAAAEAADRQASEDLLAKAARADALLTEAERRRSGLDFAAIDDGQNVVLYKREAEDLEIRMARARDAEEWEKAAGLVGRYLEVLDTIQALDQARAGARALRERAEKARDRSAEFSDAHPDLFAQGVSILREAEDLYQRGRFDDSAIRFEQAAVHLDGIDNDGAYEETYAELKAKFIYHFEQQKWLLERAWKDDYDEINRLAAEAAAAPPRYKKGVDLYREAAELVDTVLKALQQSKEMNRFRELYEKATASIENKDWRSACSALAEALMLEIKNKDELKAMYREIMPLREAGTKRTVQVGGTAFEVAWIPPTVEDTWRDAHLNKDYFMMGDDTRFSKEVRIVMGFWIGVHEVTQEQWEKVMGANPSRGGKGGQLPVDSVSWDDAQEFVEKLNALYDGDDLVFRLPTESEWEHSCRAGTATAYFSGDTVEDLARVAVYWDTSKGKVQVVGSRGTANAWGLLDTHGNVREWCEDDWHGSIRRIPGDGSPLKMGLTPTELRASRGGSWISRADTCRSGYRKAYPKNERDTAQGLRIVLSR